MGNWLSDVVLPAVGGAAGYYYGGATGAAIGSGGGRLAGGYLKQEDTDANLRNSMAAAMIGYGGGKAVDYGANQWGGDSAMFGSGNTGVGGYSATPQAGSSGGGWGGGGGSGMGSNLPAMMVINALAQMYGASSAKDNANDIYNQQLANWRNTAYPNTPAVDAQSDSAISGINQQSMIARQKLMDSMAARGMGANSGIIAGASAEEDRARRQRLAQLANNMIQFRNTPMYAPPQLQYTKSAGEGIADSTSGVAGLYAGMGLYNQMR